MKGASFVAETESDLRNPQILVVDNYDSFVFNLVQYLGQMGITADVWRNDDDRLGGGPVKGRTLRGPQNEQRDVQNRDAAEQSAAEYGVQSGGEVADPEEDTDAQRIQTILRDVVRRYDGILISPGPGSPEHAGASLGLVEACAATKTPLFGVCLGHQSIGASFGAVVGRADELLHGKTSKVYHDNTGVLKGLPSPFTATRYHSLTVMEDTIPDDLVVTARTESNVVMAMRHRTLPIHSVQFHPESVMTEGGHRMLANWLSVCGIAVDETLVEDLENEMRQTVGRLQGDVSQSS